MASMVLAALASLRRCAGSTASRVHLGLAGDGASRYCISSHYGTAPTAHHQHAPGKLLVAFVDDAQQSECSDECRMLFGRHAGIDLLCGDVPLLVEEGHISRTVLTMESEEQTKLKEDNPSLVSGVSVFGTRFDEGTEILIAQANREAFEQAAEGAVLRGVVTSEEWEGLPDRRRVWARPQECALYDLPVCPLLPNTVSSQPTDGSSILYRTTMPWYSVRLFHPVCVADGRTFSPRIEAAIRRWSIQTSSWWSVWGTAEQWKQRNIEVMHQPIEIMVVDEWGDQWVLVSPASCVDPKAAVNTWMKWASPID